MFCCALVTRIERIATLILMMSKKFSVVFVASIYVPVQQTFALDYRLHSLSNITERYHLDSYEQIESFGDIYFRLKRGNACYLATWAQVTVSFSSMVYCENSDKWLLREHEWRRKRKNWGRRWRFHINHSWSTLRRYIHCP